MNNNAKEPGIDKYSNSNQESMMKINNHAKARLKNEEQWFRIIMQNL